MMHELSFVCLLCSTNTGSTNIALDWRRKDSRLCKRLLDYTSGLIPLREGCLFQSTACTNTIGLDDACFACSCQQHHCFTLSRRSQAYLRGLLLLPETCLPTQRSNNALSFSCLMHALAQKITQPQFSLPIILGPTM